MLITREDLTTRICLFVCLGSYTVSTVYQLYDGDISQIHVSWTIFNQHLISPLSRHWQVSHNAIPIILRCQGGKPLPLVLTTLVCCGQGSNPQPPAHEADALTTRPPPQSLTTRNTHVKYKSLPHSILNSLAESVSP